MRILGLSSFTHDTSAALLEDGVVRAAVEESKLLRTKSTSGLPDAAIQFCLRTAGVTWRDLDYVAVSSRPLHGWLRRSLAGARIFPLSPIAAAYCQVGEIGRVARELGNFRTLRHPNEVHAAKVVEFEHHLCHAANAFFLSPFDRALILTMDEEGDGRSAMLAVGTGNRIRAVRSMQYPHSLAWLYSQVTAFWDLLRTQMNTRRSGSASRASRSIATFFMTCCARAPMVCPALIRATSATGRVGTLSCHRSFVCESEWRTQTIH